MTEEQEQTKLKFNLNIKLKGIHLFIISQIFLFIELFLVFVIFLLFYLNINTNSLEVVKVPKGSNSNAFKSLQNRGYDINFFDKLLIKSIGNIQGGWIHIGSKRLTKGDFLYKLAKGKAATRDVILIPGETIYFFIKQLSKKLLLNEDKLTYYFNKHSPYKDGSIVPNTYRFPLGMSEERVIKILLDRSDKYYKKLSIKLFSNYYQKEWYKYLTIASIIQKEAGNKKEMPLVSSVIYNRLNKNMKLQVDGALNYGKYSHTKVTRKMIRKDRTKFNTYKYKGLPKYPICAVSFDAIKSAIFPSKTKYLYFMKTRDNGHTFSKTYKEHLRIIKNL
jgi:UPF0755 protein